MSVLDKQLYCLLHKEASTSHSNGPESNNIQQATLMSKEKTNVSNTSAELHHDSSDSTSDSALSLMIYELHTWAHGEVYILISIYPILVILIA